LVTPTQDLGKILSALKKTKLGGQVDIVTAIQVAQLALKHRQNKNLRQRIIAYVGSPLGEMVDEKTLVRVGKKLKKNNVALDVIAYGEFENNEQRLRALIDAVQNNDNRYDDFHKVYLSRRECLQIVYVFYL
jgi:26S proteasome regulatory subunit N10